MAIQFGSLPSGTSPMSALPAALPGKRILICEDEGITQMQLRRCLTRAGMTVVGTAVNGREGVEIALREHPDLVLMDIRMPVMNGLEAVELIAADYLPCIVMLSAFNDAETQEQAKSLGASGYIVKPVTGETLVPRLEEIWADFQKKAM